MYVLLYTATGTVYTTCYNHQPSCAIISPITPSSWQYSQDWYDPSRRVFSNIVAVQVSKCFWLSPTSLFPYWRCSSFFDASGPAHRTRRATLARLSFCTNLPTTPPPTQTCWHQYIHPRTVLWWPENREQRAARTESSENRETVEKY